MEHIPYKGASEVQTALLGQQIHVMFVTPPSVLSVVKEGKLRAIGYTGSKPFPELPDVPLVRDALPGFALSPSWSMLYAPAKTPDAIVEKLNAAVQHAQTVAGGDERDAAQRLCARTGARRRKPPSFS